MKLAIVGAAVIVGIGGIIAIAQLPTFLDVVASLFQGMVFAVLGYLYRGTRDA